MCNNLLTSLLFDIYSFYRLEYIYWLLHLKTKRFEWLLAYPCVPKIINLIDNRPFVSSFLQSILVTTNSRHPATISPSLVLNRTELIEIPYLSAGKYTCHEILFSWWNQRGWDGEACGMHGETRQAYKLLVGKLAGVRPPGTPRYKWEDNIKMDLK